MHWAYGDQPVTVGLVVDLKRGVLDLEARIEQLLQAAADGMAILARLNQHVGGKSGEPGDDLPYVEVVDVGDTRVAQNRGTDLLGIQAAGAW